MLSTTTRFCAASFLVIAIGLLEMPASMGQGTGNPAVFATLLGGSGQENLRDITSDAEGNIYVTGGTSSPDYPTTPGAYDRSFATGGGSLGSGGPMDVFIAKYTPDGTLIFSTYLGGPNYDRAYAIEVDDAGYIYVGGRAGDEFPTTDGVLQTDFGGDRSPNGLYGKQDAFVAKLSPNGDSLIWATYFGSDDIGFARDIDIDADGAVYLSVTGATRPWSHITTGAFQTDNNGAKDLIVAKISPDASRVEWATYYGGGADDGLGPAIRVHSDKTVTVVGSTHSSDLPLAGVGRGFQGGESDLFVARFSADGADLIYATYFGGSGRETVETHALAIDAEGNAWVTGHTKSDDLPVTPGVFQPEMSGDSDTPIGKFRATDGALLYCSYLGGSDNENAQGIAIGRDGSVFIGGGTSSTDFPVTSDAAQSTSLGGYDMTATVLAPDLSRIIYATRYGGSNADDGRTLWADDEGNIYLAGHTDSRNVPLVDAEQSVYGGGRNDGLVVRIQPQYAPVDDRTLIDIGPRCFVVTEAELIDHYSIIVHTPQDSAITVRLWVSGTANIGQDHSMPADTVVVIPAGARWHDVDFRIYDDGIPEQIESIIITPEVLSGPARTDPKLIGSYYITDDERPPTNLLADPGFEANATPWQKTTNGGRSIAGDNTFSGEGSARIVGSQQYVREIFQDLPVLGGQLYLAYGKVIMEKVDRRATIAEIIWFAGDDEVGRSQVAISLQTSPPAWSSFSRCARAPVTADRARFRIFLETEPDDDATIWFDELGFLAFDAPSSVEGTPRLLPIWLELR